MEVSFFVLGWLLEGEKVKRERRCFSLFFSYGKKCREWAEERFGVMFLGIKKKEKRKKSREGRVWKEVTWGGAIREPLWCSFFLQFISFQGHTSFVTIFAISSKTNFIVMIMAFLLILSMIWMILISFFWICLSVWIECLTILFLTCFSLMSLRLICDSIFFISCCKLAILV